MTPARRFYLALSIAVLSVCSGIRHAQAAVLYFDPSSLTAGTDGVFEVALLIDAAKPVNAFDVKVQIPSGLEVMDVSDGDSLINFWIQRPIFDQKSRLLSFSGIVPGGFAGRGGRLSLVSLKAMNPGSFALSYGADSTIMLNEQTPRADTITSLSLPITVVAGKQNLANQIPDNDPPEAFMPYIATFSAILSGRNALYFETQDKGSGIFGYQVAESRNSAQGYASLSWHDAASPYVLDDQSLSSYIYVKAMDKAGNERIESLSPVHQGSWSRPVIWDIITLSVLALFVLWFLFIKKSKPVSR